MFKTALKRVSVSRWTNFHKNSYMQNAVWTIFEQLYFEILRAVWETEKKPKNPEKISAHLIGHRLKNYKNWPQVKKNI